MAIETGLAPQVGDTEPCPTCGHVKEPEKRLHELACCGLDSHAVNRGYAISELTHYLVHYWRDDKTYSAVKSEREISEIDALAWLERAHSGEVPRRGRHEALTIEAEWWTD